jgi:hypothetical protein
VTNLPDGRKAGGMGCAGRHTWLITLQYLQPPTERSQICQPEQLTSSLMFSGSMMFEYIGWKEAQN